MKVELGIKYIRNEEREVKYVIPHSFDIGLFKLKFKKLGKKNFVKEVTITKVKDELVNKELLKEQYPEAFKECNKELTPRVTIK